MNDQIVRIWVNTLEAGSHISREVIERRLVAQLVLPFRECAEERPDWGVYHLIVTFPAVERSLRRHGHLGYLDRDHQWSFSVEDHVAA